MEYLVIDRDNMAGYSALNFVKYTGSKKYLIRPGAAIHLYELRGRMVAKNGRKIKRDLMDVNVVAGASVPITTLAWLFDDHVQSRRMTVIPKGVSDFEILDTDLLGGNSVKMKLQHDKNVYELIMLVMQADKSPTVGILPSHHYEIEA